YFALYQFRLAILLTNYWNTEPQTFSKARVQELIDEIHTNVNKQKTDRIKPPVPDNKFVDTRTMLMWDKTPVWVSGAVYKWSLNCKITACTQNDFNLADQNWRQRASTLGTEDDFKRLIDGWGGVGINNPLEWLRMQVGFVTSAPANTPRDWIGHMWLGP